MTVYLLYYYQPYHVGFEFEDEPNVYHVCFEFEDEPNVGRVATNIPPHIDTSIKFIQLSQCNYFLFLTFPSNKIMHVCITIYLLIYLKFYEMRRTA